MLSDLPRREFIVAGGATLTAAALFSLSRLAHAFPDRPGDTVIPWLDQPPPGSDPCCDTQLVWEDLEAWITPNDKFFSVSHFDRPAIDPASWKLAIDGFVERPVSLSLADLR